MAKKALLDVLEQTIGKYVKNLDAESLNVAVWSGKIELNNLELDINSVNAELDRQAAERPNLELPFRVRSGRFEKFQVDVPWSHLMSRPVVLRAQGLQVSVEPRDRSETMDYLYTHAESEAVRQRRIVEQRVRSIQVNDEFRQKSNTLTKLAVSSEETAGQPTSTFTTRLARRILENVQMEIQNVHIELKDNNNSAGLVLKSLRLETTDKDGNRAFVDRTAAKGGLDLAFLHKSLQIAGLGIYVDELSNRRGRTSLGTIGEEGEEYEGLDHSYILAPLSFAARLRQADSNVCVDHPKYTLVSELECLSLLLSKRQLEQIRKIHGKISPAHDVARPLFPEYRPLTRVSRESAAEWWKYAFRCVGRVTGRRSWVEYFRAFQLRKQYIPLYKRNAHHAESPWLRELNSTEQRALQQIEDDRSISVEGLMIWRNIADAQFDKEREKHLSRTGSSVASKSLFSSLFGTTSGANTTTAPSATEPPITLSVEEMKELEVVTMDHVQDAELSTDSKLCDMKFTLGSFRMHLTSQDLRQIAVLNMGKVSTSFDANVNGSFVFHLQLASLEILDKATPRSLFPAVLRHQENQEHVFGIRYEKSAVGDQILAVTLKEFEAVASPALITEVQNFLSTAIPQSSGKSLNRNPMLAQSLSGSVDLFYDATESFGQVPAPSVSWLADEKGEEPNLSSKIADFSKFAMLQRDSSLKIDCDLHAPILVLPENCSSGSADVLVFDMGHMKFQFFKERDNPTQLCSVSLSQLAFLTGKTRDRHGPIQKRQPWNSAHSDGEVVHPFSLSVQCSINTESSNSSLDVPAIDIHARFSRLLVIWKPATIKFIATQLERFQSIFSNAEDSSTEVIIVSPSPPIAGDSYRLGSSGLEHESSAGVSFRFVAELEEFRVSLNSAQDSLPLFMFKMSNGKVSRISSGPDHTVTSLTLDDVSIETPETGTTRSEYRVLLGLSPEQNTSLLVVNYYEGSRAIERGEGRAESGNLEAFGTIELSCMRMVYIHSQVLALVEYATGGILGTLTTQVASTAALAAVSLTVATSSRKLFSVRANDFEILLPQAAYNPFFFAVRCGVFRVNFSTWADTSLSADVEVSNFELRNTSGHSLQREPIAMSVEVTIPSDSVAPEEEPINISVSITQSRFICPRQEYCQLMATLTENLGESDLCLRNDLMKIEDATGVDTGAAITHGGTLFVENLRGMRLVFVLAAMSLELCSESFDNPIIRLTAVDASIKFETFPTEEKTRFEITLHDLNCDDIRPRAQSRQYRALIYQNDNIKEDVFFVAYESEGSSRRKIDVSIGRSNHVVIPDAIEAVLNYLSGDPTSRSGRMPAISEATSSPPINADDKMTPECTTVISLKTGRCSLALVDLGTEDLLRVATPVETVQVASVVESIVFDGKFDLHASMTNDSAAVEIHCETLECYSAIGRSIESAVQILEPTKLSLYLKDRLLEDRNRELVVRAAAMERLELSLSMKNFALMNAISSSITTCFAQASDKSVVVATGIDEGEAERIERLAYLLANESENSSSHSYRSSAVSSGASLASRETSTGDLEEKRTSVSLHTTVPEVVFTVINDLQGLDEPLLRGYLTNSVSNATVHERHATADSDSKMFDFNSNVSIAADFFDQSTYTWQAALAKPWEISMKGRRTPSHLPDARASTMVDIECFPCHISFSEQFLMGMASASRMWSVYSGAVESASIEHRETKEMRKSIAASAARKFVASLPYAIENSSGRDVFFVIHGEEERRFCKSGSLEYFRFRPPKGRGAAGKRQYGQDITFHKSIVVEFGEKGIPIEDLDFQLNSPRRACILDDNEVLMIEVVREGKTIVIHLSSGIEIRNECSLPFSLSVSDDSTDHVTICQPHTTFRPSVLSGIGGKMSKTSRLFSIPTQVSRNFWRCWIEGSVSNMNLVVSPMLRNLPEGWELRGALNLSIESSDLLSQGEKSLRRQCEVYCQPYAAHEQSDSRRPEDCDPFVLRALISFELVEGRFPAVNVVLEPRTTLKNMMPVPIIVESPMPHILCGPSSTVDQTGVFMVGTGSCIEIFTPGPSIAVRMKFAEVPVGGTATDWMEGGWVDLPLVPEFRLADPLRCIFPFASKNQAYAFHASGIEFFLCQGSPELSDAFMERLGANLSTPANESLEVSRPDEIKDPHQFFVTVANVAVDHIGDILFELCLQHPGSSVRRSSIIDRSQSSAWSQASPPLGAFATALHRGRATLLPTGNSFVRLLHLTMDGDDGVRKSLPFRVEDVSICDGGLDSTPLRWEDGTYSGFFLYKELTGMNQSELHVVPEYVVYNGSKSDEIRIRQPGGHEFLILAGHIAPLRTDAQQQAIISVESLVAGGRTAPMRVDSLGLRVAIVRAPDGVPVGSIAVQTVVGGRDSRLVIKLGGVKFGGVDVARPGAKGMFDNDTLRFRVQCSEFRLSLFEARPVVGREEALVENAMDRMLDVVSPTRSRSGKTSSHWVNAREKMSSSSLEAGKASGSWPVCTVVLHRFAIDWQRVFKEGVAPSREAVSSPERAQFSVIVHNIQILDDADHSPYPVVLESSSSTSFFDLCVRFKGSLSSELIKVDLFDLKLAHRQGVSQRIIVNTSEDFVWKFLDLADRILAAAGEFAGVDMELAWDEEHDGYKVVLRDQKPSYIEDLTHYSPPASDLLLDINRAHVSPFSVVVSFKRNPQAMRYTKMKGVRGAKIMNYFTRRLKFKIEKAELNFARFEQRNIKGPPDRLLELISTVYMSRIKLKFVTLMTAASFQDWKFLADREEGDDAYVEGDLLRVSGNVAGSTANALFKHAGRGLGQGVSRVTGAVGNSIEVASEAIGAKPVGAGVNSMVSGVGDGVAHTITGVGKGAGKMFKGAGQGVGHVVGGVAGGALMMGKGIGKGIATGDGKAFTSGFSEGFSSVGSGVGQGLDSVVTGATEGVLSVGQGLFSGVKSVGKGIGGAFLGKSPKKRGPRGDKR